MIALNNFKCSRIRPTFLLGLGAHLGISGFLVLAMYYLVTQISVQEARTLLGWVIPAAQGCCFFGALSLAAGLSVRERRGLALGRRSSRGWIIRKIMPFGNRSRSDSNPVRKQRRRPAPSEVEHTLSQLKSLDWKTFRDLGVAYFREVGFRVVEQPGRSAGVDFLLYLEDDYNAIAVRCLPWGTEKVDLKQVREFHRATLLAGASQGVMFTTGGFEKEAIELGQENDLELLCGEAFVTRLLSMPLETSRRLLEEAAGAERIREEGKEERKERKKKSATAERSRWL